MARKAATAKGPATKATRKRGPALFVYLEDGLRERLEAKRAELEAATRAKVSWPNSVTVKVSVSDVVRIALETYLTGENLAPRVLEVVRSLATGPGRSARLALVRARLGDVPRAELDKALIALDREGLVSLGRPVDLAALTPEDKAAALEDPARGRLIFVTLSGPK